MPHLLITSLVTLLSALTAGAAENDKHLFILSGQSNMARLDPNLSFTPTVKAAFGKENVTVVKDDLGGQPIRRWYKDWKPVEGYDPKATGFPLARKGKSFGDLYDRVMVKVRAAVEEREFATITFAWMQGERDAKESHGEVYAASMKGLIGQISTDLGRPDIHFIIGRLSDFDMGNAKYPHWTMVREAQVKVAEADSRGGWVDTDDLNDGLNKSGKKIKNDLHYSVEGYKEFGRRLADKSIALIQGKNQPVSAAPGTVHKSVARKHPVIRLWTIDQIGGEQNRLEEKITNRGKIRFENVKDPNLTIYQVESKEPTPAVIYCPGGAYKHLTPKPEVVEWLNDNGITVFMLKYTVPSDREAAFRDVQRAMRVARENAGQWNIDPDQLGALGSSAGGHLVARLSQNYASPAYPAFDEADNQSCEPAFVILTSAAYFFEGKGKTRKPVLAKEFPMKAKVAPTFLVYAKDDRNFFPGGVAYENALKTSGGATRMMISETGGHGLKDVEWYPECREWLKEIGIRITGKKQ